MYRQLIIEKKIIKKISLLLTTASIFASGLDLFASETGVKYFEFTDILTLENELKAHGGLIGKIYIRCSMKKVKELGDIFNTLPANVGLELDIKDSPELKLDIDDLPNWVKRLRITNNDNSVERIWHDFLTGYRCLQELDLTYFANVKMIGWNFLSGCSGLTSLHLPPLVNITTIGPNFLFCCSELTSLDLTIFRNVKVIGPYFLSGCSGLTGLDLTTFNKVTKVRSHFLSECSGLTGLDLTSFEQARFIGEYFLYGALVNPETVVYNGSTQAAVAKAIEEKFGIPLPRGG